MWAGVGGGSGRNTREGNTGWPAAKQNESRACGDTNVSFEMSHGTKVYLFPGGEDGGGGGVSGRTTGTKIMVHMRSSYDEYEEKKRAKHVSSKT